MIAGNRTSVYVYTRCDLPYTRAAFRCAGSPRAGRNLRRPGVQHASRWPPTLGGTHARQFAVRRGHGAGRRRPRHLPRRARLRRLPGQGRPGRRPGHGEDARDRAGGAGRGGGLPETAVPHARRLRRDRVPPAARPAGGRGRLGHPRRAGRVLPGRRLLLGDGRLHRHDAGHPRQRPGRRGAPAAAATARPSASRTAPAASSA